MTAQNIHLVKPPPMANVIVPSRRRLTPASTRDSRAADGASKSRTEIMSLSSCGVAICPIPHLETYMQKKHPGFAGSPYRFADVTDCLRGLRPIVHGHAVKSLLRFRS